jgi:hypothetical protein
VLISVSLSFGSGIIDPKSHAMRSKHLSLQLLLYILENSGPVFRAGDMFIGGIKKYLIVSLYSNATLKDQTTFLLMSQIFSLLMTLFPAHLKVGPVLRLSRCSHS